jgi:hypothetical protein
MAIRCCKLLLEHNIPIAIAIMHLWVMNGSFTPSLHIIPMKLTCNFVAWTQQIAQ